VREFVCRMAMAFPTGVGRNTVTVTLPMRSRRRVARSAESHSERDLRRAPEFVAGVSEQDATIGGPVEFALEGDAMDVQFITNVAVITPEPAVSRRLYVDGLGLPLTEEGDGYLHSEDIDGCKSFGLWPLTQAAQACFGMPDWPAARPVPQASVEFEVADSDTVQVAADELKDKGFTLLHDARTEPWGQTVARLQSVEGAIIGISYMPTMHS
jgi:catechol 2,3-dioxygenase-like lactoylglutathione lyase family enzyme